MKLSDSILGERKPQINFFARRKGCRIITGYVAGIAGSCITSAHLAPGVLCANPG